MYIIYYCTYFCSILFVLFRFGSDFIVKGVAGSPSRHPGRHDACAGSDVGPRAALWQGGRARAAALLLSNGRGEGRRDAHSQTVLLLQRQGWAPHTHTPSTATHTRKGKRVSEEWTFTFYSAKQNTTRNSSVLDLARCSTVRSLRYVKIERVGFLLFLLPIY